MYKQQQQISWNGFRSDPDHLSQHIDYQYHGLRQTLLHCACKKGHEDLVRWLVEEKHANLDIIDINSQTALHLAAHRGHQPIVTFLLEHGADATLINKWGMTAEQEGLYHDEKITRIFEKMRAKDMYQMAIDGKEWWFRYHFDDGLINEVSDKGSNVLYLACRHGHRSLAKWLIEHRANVNIQLQEAKSTPITWCCIS